MLGAIIGDIVGSRFEFNPTNDYNFELFTDECDFTDDTICTLEQYEQILVLRKEKRHSIHTFHNIKSLTTESVMSMDFFACEEQSVNRTPFMGNRIVRMFKELIGIETTSK